MGESLFDYGIYIQAKFVPLYRVSDGPCAIAALITQYPKIGSDKQLCLWNEYSIMKCSCLQSLWGVGKSMITIWGAQDRRPMSKRFSGLCGRKLA